MKQRCEDAFPVHDVDVLERMEDGDVALRGTRAEVEHRSKQDEVVDDDRGAVVADHSSFGANQVRGDDEERDADVRDGQREEEPVGVTVQVFTRRDDVDDDGVAEQRESFDDAQAAPEQDPEECPRENYHLSGCVVRQNHRSK